jgi:hypothetical protein
MDNKFGEFDPNRILSDYEIENFSEYMGYYKVNNQIKIGDIVKYKNRKYVIIEIERFEGSEMFSMQKEIRIHMVRYYEYYSHPKTRQVIMLKNEELEQLTPIIIK